MIDRRTVMTGLGAGFVASSAAAAARWQPIASVPWPVQEVYGTVWRGKAVIAGGMAPKGGVNPQDGVGIYDPRTDAWTHGPKLPSPRHHPVLATARDRVYAFGGLTVTSAGIWVAIKDAVALGEDGSPAATRRAPRPGQRRPQLDDLAADLSDRLDTRVRLALGKTKGRLTVEFASVEDLHRILEVMHLRDRAS